MKAHWERGGKLVRHCFWLHENMLDYLGECKGCNRLGLTVYTKLEKGEHCATVVLPVLAVVCKYGLDMIEGYGERPPCQTCNKPPMWTSQEGPRDG